MEESVSWFSAASQQDGPGSGPDRDGGLSQSAGDEHKVMFSSVFIVRTFILINPIRTKKGIKT